MNENENQVNVQPVNFDVKLIETLRGIEKTLGLLVQEIKTQNSILKTMR